MTDRDALIKELRDCIERECSRDGGAASGTIDAMMKAADMLEQPGDAPIDMVLHCPACGEQHIDAPTGEWEGQPWQNPPHRSHLCHACGHIWRPADVPTNGVEAIKTKGKADKALLRRPVEPVVTGQQFYEALYGHKGGGWRGVDDEARYVWNDAAKRLNAALNVSQPGVK